MSEGERLQLPDFPSLGENGFDFSLPPIPRLLPAWEQLQLQSRAQLGRGGAVAEARHVGVPVSVALGVGALSFALVAGLVVSGARSRRSPTSRSAGASRARERRQRAPEDMKKTPPRAR